MYMHYGKSCDHEFPSKWGGNGFLSGFHFEKKSDFSEKTSTSLF